MNDGLRPLPPIQTGTATPLERGVWLAVAALALGWDRLNGASKRRSQSRLQLAFPSNILQRGDFLTLQQLQLTNRACQSVIADAKDRNWCVDAWQLAD